MIGWLKGYIRELDPAGLILLDIDSVGYELSVSLQTLCKFKTGDMAELSVHTHVREDQITLFGFADRTERSLFRKLTTVSSIGARMALNLMSGMPVNELIQAIESGDEAALARTPGIGKKTAQRLILELQGKLGGSIGISSPAGSHTADVRSALLNLGYKPAQIDDALKHVEITDFESMFRATLKALG